MKALELSESLKSGFSNIYFIKGEDYYLRNLAFSTLKKLTEGEFADFNFTCAEWDDNVKSLIAECNVLPFMSEVRVVAVKNCFKASAAAIAAITAYVKQPCESTVLAIELFDESFKELYPYGITVDCGKPDSRSLNGIINHYLGGRGASITADAAVKLATLSDFDTGGVINKLDKLVAYCDGQEITTADLEQMVPPEAELQIFELTKALTQGLNRRAVELMKGLLDRGEKASYLLGNIASQYRRMLHASLSTVTDSELAGYLGVKPYAVTAARSLARGYTQTALKRAVDKLTSLEYGFKSGRFSEDDALKSAVAYLLKKEE